MASEESGALPSSRTVDKVLRLMESSDIETLDLRLGSVRLRVSQDPSQLAEPPGDLGAGPGDGSVAVMAPLTGIYYARPSPDRPLFVEVGSTVTKGQVVGLIETMKLFNEIVSEVEGEVTVILVAEGDLVESGQPLMRIAAVP